MHWVLKIKHVVLASALASAILTSTYASDENLQFIAKFKTSEEREIFLAEKESEDLIVKSIDRSISEVLKFDSLEDVKTWEEAHTDLLDYLVEDTIIEISKISEPVPMVETTPYGIDMVNALLIDDYNTASLISTCVIDSGYDFGHPDLQAVNIDGVGDLCVSNPCPWDEDTSGHGTHVTGTIAAIGGNSVGVIGVVRGGLMPLYILRVFDASGSTYTSNVIDAMYECDTFGANVVNMSLGSSFYNSAYDTAITTILGGNNSILFVAAAGNGGGGFYGYPASISEFVSVGSVDSSKNLSYFSQYNDEIDLVGPGSSVQSTYPPFSYAYLSGTSMATPHVVGVAALVWSHFPFLTALEVRAALEATAEDLGATGRDDYYGHGLVDAEAAYNYLLALYPPITSGPTPSPTSSPTSSPTISCVDPSWDFSIADSTVSCELAVQFPCNCDYPEFASYCRSTCGCAEYQCIDSPVTFLTPTGTPITCATLGFLDPADLAYYCGLSLDIRTICPDTCGECPFTPYLLDFEEDVVSGQALSSDPESGLAFGNVYGMDPVLEGFTNGYLYGTFGTFSVYNAFGATGIVECPGGSFSLIELYITPAWEDGLSYIFTGTKSDSSTVSKSLTLGTTTAAILYDDWAGFTDLVSFEYTATSGSLSHIVFDNMSVEIATPCIGGSSIGVPPVNDGSRPDGRST